MGAKKGRHRNVDEAVFHTKIRKRKKKIAVYNIKQCTGGRKNCPIFLSRFKKYQAMRS